MLATFVPHETTILERMISLAGIPILVLVAWLMSSDRKKVSFRSRWKLRYPKCPSYRKRPFA